MPEPFQRIVSVPQLTAAWDKVSGNRGGPGGDGETLADFARAAEARIARLSFELEAGLYRPGPLRRIKVPKRSGGMRQLAIPSVVDRIAQGSAAMVLSELLEPHFEPASFAYRPGRSVKQAVDRVAALRRQGYRFVVDGDIRSFFDEVPHGPVLGKLGALVRDHRVIALVGLWLESFSAEKHGLAQGSPLSPLLSNLYLDALDETFDNGPVRIVRFADDFVLLCRSRDKAEAALAQAAAFLQDHGLALNVDKTRIVPFEKAFQFLGHLFVRSVVSRLENEAVTTADHDIPAGTLPVAQRAVHPGPDDALAPAFESVADPAIAEDDGAPRRPGLRLIPSPDRDPLAGVVVDRSADDFTAGLAPLYVLEPGRRLALDHEAFVVTDGGRRLLIVPAARVGRIDLGPEVEADDRSLRLAAAHRIPVAFLDGLGQPQAVLMPNDLSHAGLHLAQARDAIEPTRSVALARCLVSQRVRNARALLKRLNRRRKRSDVETACERMMLLARKAASAPGLDIDQLRGIEGEAANVYWLALGGCLEHGFGLVQRREESGRNPVNAVLDFTASLLTRDMRAAVLRAGLHPGFGTLHAGADGREACVYDLVEAFRAPLAEALAVYLFNNRIIGHADYGAKAYTMRLSSAAGRKLVQTYEAWLARPVKNPRTGHSTSWRGLLLAEARAFASATIAQTPFTPYAMDF